MTPSPNIRDIFACSISEIEEALKQARQLVNPASGIANDYLNQYNEILLLVENMPILLPDMIDDLLSWKPKTYKDYFDSSPLPGSQSAIYIYQALTSAFREKFESHIEGINTFANTAISVIGIQRDQSEELFPQYIEEFCEQISKTLRTEIEKANDIVNHGLGLPPETSQEMADRLMQAS